MKIYFATDHAGFELKNELVPFVQSLGYEVEDCGAYVYDAADDYPDFIHKAAAAVSTDPTARAIILGASGQGEAMAANRYPHVRAAVYYGGTLDVVTLSREHNDANVLSLGARLLQREKSVDDIKDAVQRWLKTACSSDERHARRIAKIEC